MISMYEKVQIRSSGIVGTVVDTYEKRGLKVYIVESDAVNADGGYDLIDCHAEDLARV